MDMRKTAMGYNEFDRTVKNLCEWGEGERM
jgi:hypothetical protein